MKSILISMLALLFVSCENIVLNELAGIATSSSDVLIVSNSIAPDASEDSESVVNLPYTDANGSLATSCNIPSTNRLSITTPCSCDGAGVCTVGVTGDSDFSGSASFNFEISNGTDTSAPGRVDINVTNVNDPPVIDSISNISVGEGAAITQVDAGVAGSDQDVDGDTISYSCSFDTTVDGSEAASSNCSSLPGVVSFNTTTGVFDWTPDYSADGNYEVFIGSSDGSLTSQEIFSIAVSNTAVAPSMTSINDTVVNEGSAISSIDAEDSNSGGDTDASGNTITYQCKYDVVVDSAVSSPADCTDLAGLSFNVNTGVFDWTPDQQANSNGDASGRYEFKIIASSSDGSSDEVFAVTVNAVNVAPILASQSDVNINVNEAINIDNGSGGDDQDPDGDTISYTCSWDNIDNNLEDAANSCNLNSFIFNTSTGVLSGLPDTAGTYEFKVIGSSSGGSDTLFFTVVVTVPAGGVSSIATDNHSCIINTDGDAYCWGYDNREQLGDGVGTSNKASAVAIDTSNLGASEKFVAISPGFTHSCGVTNDNKTYCWGYDAGGRLGSSFVADESIPTPIDTSNFGSGEYLLSAKVGTNHSCGITNNNRTFCWGENGRGQVSNGATAYRQNLPSLINSSTLNSGEYFSQLESGSSYSCGVTNQNNAYCWGFDESGKLGYGGSTGDKTTPALVDNSTLSSGESFLQISTGASHTCALTNQNKVYCWGSDQQGRLGNGSVSGSKQSPSLIDDSNLSSGEYFTKLDLGRLHSCGRTNQNKVYCWGYGSFGQLGDSANSNRNKPVLVAQSNLDADEYFTEIALGPWSDTTCGVTNKAKAFCWGYDQFEGLGDGSGTTNVNVPTQVTKTW